MTINGITPGDLEWVRFDSLVVGDRIVHAHRALQSIAVRPTAKQLAHRDSTIQTVSAIGPYIPAPGARNAHIADTLMVVNPGTPEESTGTKDHFIWIVKR
jgi:hypothetical protein